MPNWTFSTLTIEGNKDKIAEIAVAAEAGTLLEYCVPIGEWDYMNAVNNWGTKWEADVSSVELVDGCVTIVMNTAWSPPIQALDGLLEQDGVDHINCSYIEEGMDYAGIYEDGVDISVTISEVVDKIIAGEELELQEAYVADDFDNFEYQVEYRKEEMEEENVG